MTSPSQPSTKQPIDIPDFMREPQPAAQRRIMSNVTVVTDETFAAEVLAATGPVLVDYWADWCQPCRQLTPVIDELADKYAGQVKFVSVDTNANTAVAAAQDIRTLPTIQIFQNGEVVEAIVGAVTKMKLRQALESVA